MKRLDFLKMVKQSLQETVVETTTPIVEDDLQHVQNEWLLLNGMRWHEVAISPSPSPQIIWVNQQPIIFSMQSQKLKAYKCMCQQCHTPLQYQAFDKKIICLSCSYKKDLSDVLLEQILEELPVKKEENKFFVALPK